MSQPTPHAQTHTAQPAAGHWSQGRSIDRHPLSAAAALDAPRVEDARNRDARFRALLVTADIAVAAVALGVATWVSGADALRPAALLAVPVLVLLSKALGLYDRDELVLLKSTLDEAPGVFQLATLFSLLVWLTESWLVAGAFEKFQFVLLWAVTFLGVLSARSVARAVAERTAPPERCLLLGPPAAATLVTAKLAHRGSVGARVVARTDLEDAHGNVLVAGGLAKLVRETGAHRVILVPTATESDAVIDLIREAKSIGVKASLLPRFSEVLGSSVVLDDLGGVTLLGVRRLGLPRSSWALKRSFDLLLSLVGLVGLAPLLAVIALAIRLDSKGPALYSQTRVGRRGEPFRMLKFRTMVVGADEHKAELQHLNGADGLFKIADDPRVTRVGRFLRRTALDELPQLVNVLRGQMSLVGPRPLVAEDDRRIVGWHRDRLSLLPGMTGHWQVLGAARVPLHEMVAIDYLYVANWSLWTDLKCLLRTVPYVLRARGF
jgi:exopolysaccharide biosynthesis polyprenyl glycosylphosphotransferase